MMVTRWKSQVGLWWKHRDGNGRIYGAETGGRLRRIRGGKTGRKCSQLDCDLRPYEQLW